MSLSRITYAADGSTQSFGVPFVFRDRVDVFVYVGENILVNGIAATFTWQNDSQITVTLPLVTNGVEVQIIRRTKSTALDVTFIDGSGLPAGDLNAAVLQLYYLLQESLDDLGDYADGAASAAAALVSENAAAADLALTNADVVLTNADVVLTNADVVLTNADVVLTNADVVLTNADVVLTNADVVLTNADVVTTGNVVGAVAMPYVFNATTTMADPTTGLFRLNSATPASVTAIAIDDTTNATGNPDISAFLATWDDSSSNIKGTLQIVQEDTPANFMTFNITALTDNAGWVQLTVAHVAGSTLFGSAKACRLQFIRNGDAGAATDLTAPGPIGSVTASTGDFTTLNSTGGALNGTLGATTASTGDFTTLNSTGGALNGTLGATTASTGAFTTLTSSTSLDIGSTIAITGVLDEDNMSSNSAVKLATQQSIKAYVDTSIPAAGAMEVFTSSGTWTQPTGITKVRVMCVGGGAGSGTNGYGGQANGGAGGGVYGMGVYTVSGNIAVTVGAGGAGAAGFNTTGSNGGATSFGSLLSVNGGASSGATTVGGAGGTGGTFTTGTLEVRNGISGAAGGGAPGSGGAGGDSGVNNPVSYQQAPVGGGPNLNGNNATGYGNGGSAGGNNATAGGNGAAGVVIVMW